MVISPPDPSLPDIPLDDALIRSFNSLDSILRQFPQPNENSNINQLSNRYIPFELTNQLTKKDTFGPWFNELLYHAKIRDYDLDNNLLLNDTNMPNDVDIHNLDELNNTNSDSNMYKLSSNFKAAIYMSISYNVFMEIGGHAIFALSPASILEIIKEKYRPISIREMVNYLNSVDLETTPLDSKPSNQANISQYSQYLSLFSKDEIFKIMILLKIRREDTPLYLTLVSSSKINDLSTLMNEMIKIAATVQPQIKTSTPSFSTTTSTPTSTPTKKKKKKKRR